MAISLRKALAELISRGMLAFKAQKRASTVKKTTYKLAIGMHNKTSRG